MSGASPAASSIRPSPQPSAAACFLDEVSSYRLRTVIDRAGDVTQSIEHLSGGFHPLRCAS